MDGRRHGPGRHSKFLSPSRSSASSNRPIFRARAFAIPRDELFYAIGLRVSEMVNLRAQIELESGPTCTAGPQQRLVRLGGGLAWLTRYITGAAGLPRSDRRRGCS